MTTRTVPPPPDHQSVLDEWHRGERSMRRIAAKTRVNQHKVAKILRRHGLLPSPNVAEEWAGIPEPGPAPVLPAAPPRTTSPDVAAIVAEVLRQLGGVSAPTPQPEPIPPAAPVAPPAPPPVATKRTEGANESLVEFESDVPIRTLEDALTHAEVDLTTWYVDRWECTSWQVGMKLREFGDKGKVTGEKPVKKNLWRVCIHLKRIMPKALRLATDAIFARMAEYAPEYPAKLPESRKALAARDPHLMEIDLFDVHFGKLAWAPETGQDYDLKIAERVFRNAVEDLLLKAASFPVARIVVPIGNDFYHIDNAQNTTTAGTPQDTDGRYAKIFETGFAAMIWAIERMMTEAEVEVIWIPGNHDRTTSYHLAQTIAVWFRNSPRVKVDYGPKLRKYVRYGNALIGFTHGNEEPSKSLPGIMANEMREDWGVTSCHEWRKGHVHKSKVEVSVPVDTHDGVTIRTLRSLSATDAYHYRKGYGGPRAAEAYLTSKEHGYVGHFVVNARD